MPKSKQIEKAEDFLPLIKDEMKLQGVTVTPVLWPELAKLASACEEMGADFGEVGIMALVLGWRMAREHRPLTDRIARNAATP